MVKEKKSTYIVFHIFKLVIIISFLWLLVVYAVSGNHSISKTEPQVINITIKIKCTYLLKNNKLYLEDTKDNLKNKCK